MYLFTCLCIRYTCEFVACSRLRLALSHILPALVRAGNMLARPGQARAQGAQGSQQEGHWGWFSVAISVISRWFSGSAGSGGCSERCWHADPFLKIVSNGAGRSLTKNLDEDGTNHTNCIELQHYGVHSGVAGQWVEQVLISIMSYIDTYGGFLQWGYPLFSSLYTTVNFHFKLSFLGHGTPPFAWCSMQPSCRMQRPLRSPQRPKVDWALPMKPRGRMYYIRIHLAPFTILWLTLFTFLGSEATEAAVILIGYSL